MEHYKFGSYVVEIPEKMILYKSGKKGLVSSLSDVKNAIQSKKIDGKMINSVNFKYIDGNKPMIINRGETEDGKNKFGTITIGVPLESLYISDGNKSWKLHETLTRALKLKKIDDLYSITLKPNPNISYPKVIKPADVMKIPTNIIHKSITKDTAKTVDKMTREDYKDLLMEQSKIKMELIKALNDKDVKRSKQLNNEYQKNMDILNALEEKLRWGAIVTNIIRERKDKKTRDAYIKALKEWEEERAKPKLGPKRPIGRPRKQK